MKTMETIKKYSEQELREVLAFYNIDAHSEKNIKLNFYCELKRNANLRRYARDFEDGKMSSRLMTELLLLETVGYEIHKDMLDIILKYKSGSLPTEYGQQFFEGMILYLSYIKNCAYYNMRMEAEKFILEISQKSDYPSYLQSQLKATANKVLKEMSCKLLAWEKKKEEERLVLKQNEIEEHRSKNYHSGIYAIKNINNNKIYIGKSHDIPSRWSAHRTDLNKNKHHTKKLQKEWNEFGSDAFCFIRIERVDDYWLRANREQYWIDYYKNDVHSVVYNVATAMGGYGKLKFENMVLKKELALLKGGDQ